MPRVLKNNRIFKALFEPTYSIAWIISLFMIVLLWDRPVAWLFGVGLMYLTGGIQFNYEKERNNQPVIRKNNKKANILRKKTHQGT